MYRLAPWFLHSEWWFQSNPLSILDPPPDQLLLVATHYNVFKAWHFPVPVNWPKELSSFQTWSQLPWGAASCFSSSTSTHLYVCSMSRTAESSQSALLCVFGKALDFPVSAWRNEAGVCTCTHSAAAYRDLSCPLVPPVSALYPLYNPSYRTSAVIQVELHQWDHRNLTSFL